MIVVIRVRVAVRTGRVADLSAAWLAIMATARLAQGHAPPEIARQLGQLFMKGHRLIQVGQEISQGRPFCHVTFLKFLCDHPVDTKSPLDRCSGDFFT